MLAQRARDAAVAGVVVVACVVALTAAGCGSRSLTGSPPADSGAGGTGGGAASCANVGCSPPPLCSQGCQAACGCCDCAPGERSGNLVCASGGCYEPAPATDGGSDAAVPSDAHPADAGAGGWTPPQSCLLPFDSGPCEAAIPVFALVNGTCVPRVYGGCDGNANRFFTLEECMATCEGRPAALPCPTGRVVHDV